MNTESDHVGAHASHATHLTHASHESPASHQNHQSHENAGAGGLAVSEHGYSLELDVVIFSSGRQSVGFRVIGPDGLPFSDFTPSHEKALHFIAVRRDTSGFQHVHPVMDSSGNWSVTLELTPGDWRFFADFQPAGHASSMALGIDASVAGEYTPHALPAAQAVAVLGEYTVSLAGEIAPNQPSALTFSVARDGQSVTNLEPYLAAYGHLVALRVGDLGYLHVHPSGDVADSSTPAGPEIGFVAVAPSPGTYRLFLDFQHDGVVRTAEFTVQSSVGHTCH